MQPERCEVRIENDEYKTEQQRLVKQIKRVVVLRNDHILDPYLRVLWFENTLTILTLSTQHAVRTPFHEDRKAGVSHFFHTKMEVSILVT